MCPTKDTLGVVLPVFNDWQSLAALLRDFPALAPGMSYHFTVVDDGSLLPCPDQLPFPNGSTAELLVLGTNVGHQRAICIGLIAAVRETDARLILVMDSDGEDAATAIPRLLEAHIKHPDSLVVAKRGRRSEQTSFRGLYRIYKLGFRLLAGQSIDFGNFMLIPRSQAARLIYMPELWNQLPATVLRSGLSVKKVLVDRTPRFQGRSKMTTASLISHGLSAMSIFLDRVFARLLIFFSVLGLGMGSLVVLGIILRLVTQVPIPGWAALTSSAAAIGLLQVTLAVLLLGFLNLSTRSRFSPAPMTFAMDCVFERRLLQSGPASEKSAHGG
jgi:hypothetical protein